MRVLVLLLVLAGGVAAQSLTQAQQYFQQGTEYHIGSGGKKVDLEKALQRYRQALRLDPQFYEAHVNAGKVYFARKDYRRAKVHFSDAIKAARRRTDIAVADEARVSSDLGGCYFKEGNLAEAEKWFRGALGLDPTLVEAHYNLINLLLSDDRVDEARRQMTVAAEVAPSERYGIFRGRLTTQESYASWNPAWLKVAIGAALLGGVAVAVVRSLGGKKGRRRRRRA
jgi:tetratricopeptide (TPR) repeat protein